MRGFDAPEQRVCSAAILNRTARECLRLFGVAGDEPLKFLIYGPRTAPKGVPPAHRRKCGTLRAADPSPWFATVRCRPRQPIPDWR
ncbi:hypothetical protein Amme_121_024 [Acidomonas methanolica NBRC 104435]|uniref:Uncharacterized protein n=2 Tax=Acidomonas methanolica TaxID=437 RepID=A0A023D9D5_ACIMT|nr:hypothetical protein Amme_121_024 [Acidomonas methanolica NBRC 104435]GEK98187.1 hypothetical protein AME01nite_06860 [Acidomonas methanolica NBRC 104435]